MGLLGNVVKGLIGLAPTMSQVRRDAESGNAEAQYIVGCCYERGDHGLERNYAEAAKWYRRAADQDHHAAQLYLGLLYGQGLGVDLDYIVALKWVLLAKRGTGLAGC